MNAHIQVKHLLPAWEVFRSATDIAPIRDEAHYLRMVAMLEALLDEAAGDENHTAMGLGGSSIFTKSGRSANALGFLPPPLCKVRHADGNAINS